MNPELWTVISKKQRKNKRINFWDKIVFVPAQDTRLVWKASGWFWAVHEYSFQTSERFLRPCLIWSLHIVAFFYLKSRIQILNRSINNLKRVANSHGSAVLNNNKKYHTKLMYCLCVCIHCHGFNCFLSIQTDRCCECCEESTVEESWK